MKYRPIQYTLSTLIVLGMIFCIFTPNYFLFKWGANFAVQIMLGYLFLGFVFLFFRQPKLTFTSFACCAGLCLFLKNASNPDMVPPAKTNAATVKIAHFNVASSAEDYKSTTELILQTDADLISIQEVTPDWAAVLQDGLKKKYPYSSLIVRIDPFGVGVFSKYPILKKDTFYIDSKPNLVASFRAEGEGEVVNLISSHTIPPFNSSAYSKLNDHFKLIAKTVKNISGPVITAGDYNAVPWSKEIQDFRNSANLNDSRRGFMPSFPNGDFTLFHVPVDHIFFTDEFNCIGFGDISTNASNHVGIQGSYQFTIDDEDNAETSIQ